MLLVLVNVRELHMPGECELHMLLVNFTLRYEFLDFIIPILLDLLKSGFLLSSGLEFVESIKFFHHLYENLRFVLISETTNKNKQISYRLGFSKSMLQDLTGCLIDQRK
jgi:hypothetical protein